jgi:hypothetical protein
MSPQTKKENFIAKIASELFLLLDEDSMKRIHGWLPEEKY